MLKCNVADVHVPIYIYISLFFITFIIILYYVYEYGKIYAGNIIISV